MSSKLDKWEEIFNTKVNALGVNRVTYEDGLEELAGIFPKLLKYARELEKDSAVLAALEAGGVDNWEWYYQSLQDAGLMEDDEDE